MGFATNTIHSIPVDELTGSVAVPIYATSTFVQESPGVNKGFDYSRTNNPTRKVLEDIAAKLENGSNGYAFASGLSAIDAVLKLLSYGDEIVAVNDIYGGTYRLLTYVYSKFGIKVNYVDTTDISEVEKALTYKTKLIWIESPTNPTLKISDIQSIAKLKGEDTLLVVDNTFATPASQRPLELGADIVIHSATKYLGGHSDIIAGLVITKNEKLGNQIKFIQNASGAVLSPFDSFLLIRGIETLDLRFEKHCRNAIKVASYLQSVDLIKNLYFPGINTHKNYEIGNKQAKYYGAIISFDLNIDDIEIAKEFVSNTKYFKLAESLGGAKSLICQPSLMTHKSIPKETRYETGVTDSLIRLSVGLEDAEDLINDLKTTFSLIENKIFERSLSKELVENE